MKLEEGSNTVKAKLGFDLCRTPAHSTRVAVLSSLSASLFTSLLSSVCLGFDDK